MKNVVHKCALCGVPIKMSARKLDFWLEEMGQPFVCNVCLRSQINLAVEHTNIVKAETATRVYNDIHVTPATATNHALSTNHHQQSPTRKVRVSGKKV